MDKLYCRLEKKIKVSKSFNITTLRFGSTYDKNLRAINLHVSNQLYNFQIFQVNKLSFILSFDIFFILHLILLFAKDYLSFNSKISLIMLISLFIF